MLASSLALLLVLAADPASQAATPPEAELQLQPRTEEVDARPARARRGPAEPAAKPAATAPAALPGGVPRAAPLQDLRSSPGRRSKTDRAAAKQAPGSTRPDRRRRAASPSSPDDPAEERPTVVAPPFQLDDPPAPEDAQASADPSAVASAAAARTAADDGLRLRLGVPLRWRSADVRPAQGTGIRYRKGGAPYPALALEGEVFPARLGVDVPSWLAPVGVAFAYEHAILSTRIGGASYDSSEQRAALELLYEHRLGATRLGARVGYALHRFGVDSRAPALTSRRHGLRAGVDAAGALAPWVEAVASARYAPWFATSGAEAEAHGDATGWGLGLAAGAQGPLPAALPGLGWRATYELVRFADRFDAGGGTLSRGGTGRAVYHGPVLSVTWRR